MPFHLESIPITYRRYMFIAFALFGALFIFEPTTGMVSWILEYKLEVFPFLSVKNLLGFGLFYLTLAIIYQQVT